LISHVRIALERRADEDSRDSTGRTGKKRQDDQNMTARTGGLLDT
jgi:hypothetical protein